MKIEKMFKQGKNKGEWIEMSEKEFRDILIATQEVVDDCNKGYYSEEFVNKYLELGQEIDTPFLVLRKVI